MLYDNYSKFADKAFLPKGNVSSAAYNIDGDLIWENTNKKPTIPYNSVTDEDVDKSYVWTYNLDTLRNLQQNKFTIGLETDTHFLVSYPLTFATPLKNMSKKLYMDFMCNLGDVPRGWGRDTYSDTENGMVEIMRRYINYCTCPFLVLQGNHDNNVCRARVVTHDINDAFTKQKMYDLSIKKVKETTNIVGVDQNETYYYKDFNECRVIVLNTNDYPYQTVPDTDMSEEHHTISDKQIQWFKTSALNTTKPVLIMSHAPLVASLSPKLVVPSSDTATTNMIPWNADKIVNEIETFANNGGTVVACFCGHMHEQLNVKINGINYICFGNGGYYAEIVFIDFIKNTIQTKVIGSDLSTDYGTAVDRNFSF